MMQALLNEVATKFLVTQGLEIGELQVLQRFLREF